MSNPLIGYWTLASYEAVAPDGSVERPYGDAVGQLTYDEHGHMAGQVMRPHRPHVEPGADNSRQARSAYLGYIAYFGTFELNAAGDTVVHRVQGALNPAWVGGHQVRRVRFDADHLVLEADVHKGGEVHRHVLRWRRA